MLLAADLKAIIDGGEKGWRKRLNRWTINQFVRFTAHDAQCSTGYAQKVIVEHFKSLPNPKGKDLLYFFTDELVGDALDLIEDHIRKARADAYAVA